MSSSGMDRMLMCFERDAISWLREVKNKFDSTNQQFDENFRKMFIQTSTDQLNATYSKFIMESQLNLRMGTVAVVAATGTNQTSAGRGHSPRGAVLTPNESSMVNRVQGNTIKMEMARGHSIAVSEVDLNPHVVLEMLDPHSNDDINENGVDSTVRNVVDDDNDNQTDEDDLMTVAQQTVESKPNLAYGFRDRNSSIFARRRRAISALLQNASKDRRRRPNPTKKKPVEKKFKCDQCMYSTAFKSRLKEHGMVHSTEKPFQCDICKVRMSYRHSLKKHSLRLHNVILLN